MTKAAPTPDHEIADSEAICSTTTIAALLLLGAQFPHRQFNSAELTVLSGIGRTAMSQIKNAQDTPFSLGKCTLQRLDCWLAKHPGQKQEKKLLNLPWPCQKEFAKISQSPECSQRRRSGVARNLETADLLPMLSNWFATIYAPLRPTR